jgi:signal peptidase I
VTATASPARASASDLEDTGAQLVSDVLNRCGEARLRVGGTSMLPSIRPADVLLIRRVDITSVEPDDVILFKKGRRLFVHRVVHAGLGGPHRLLITRGDNHAHDDQPVKAANLLGRVEEHLRNGVAVAAAHAPARRSRRTTRGRAFEALSRMRRLGELLRSSAARGVRRLPLLNRAAKPARRPPQCPMDVGERESSGRPARI